MPADKFPYFPLYVDDLLADEKVMAMTTLEFGAYMRLLCLAWKGKPRGSIPNDDAVLANYTGLNTENWARCKPRVLDCFSLRNDNRLYQPRMELEYRKILALIAKRRDAGKAGAEARWQLGSDGKRIANACDSQCDRNSKPMARASGSGSKNSSVRKNSKTRETEEIPESLRVPEFLRAWEEWKGYRKEARKPFGPRTVQKQLRDLEKMGPEKAVRAIEASIGHGWTGLFDPDVTRNGRPEETTEEKIKRIHKDMYGD